MTPGHIGSSTTPKCRQPAWQAVIRDTGYCTLGRLWPTEPAPAEPVEEVAGSSDAGGAAGQSPKGQPRRSDRLNRQAVGAIVGSCVKAAQLGTPMQTFITATVKRDRQGYAEGRLSLGAALRRFLDNWNRSRRRENLPPLRYVWVVENPKSKRTPGTRNPHAHILVDWSCSREDFAASAAWLEDLWGLGMLHLERVKASAPGYLLKGAGYLGKGEFSEQGPVRGNRFGRSLDIIPEVTHRLELELSPRQEAALGFLIREARQTGNRVELMKGWVHAHGLTIPSPGGLEALKSDLRILEAWAEALARGPSPAAA